MKTVVWWLAVGVLAIGLRAAEQIPAAPEDHFNDYARVVEPAAAQRLNAELAQFERETSNQILVAIYPRLPSDSSIEDYTVRVAESWRVGRAKRDNGAVLFVFVENRALYIQVGYGLEGALPDALCKRIIEDEITPRFQHGDYTAGVTAGVQAMMAAAKGEYTGTGRTVRGNRDDTPGAGVGMILFLVVMIFLSFRAARRGTVYGRHGRRAIWVGRPGGFGGGWGGFGGGGGGGGTFSGGGGSFGGGGAGGRW